MGWNPGGEQELFDLKELVNVFDLSRVQKGGDKFDPEKTKWFQHHYLQQMGEDILTEAFLQLLKDKAISPIGQEAKIVSMLKERATFVADLWEQGSFFYQAPTHYDEKASKKAFKEDTSEIMEKVIALLLEADDFTAECLSETIKGWINEQGIGFGKVMMPLRLSLVGEMKGPDVFDILAILGKEEALNRLKTAISLMP